MTTFQNGGIPSRTGATARAARVIPRSIITFGDSITYNGGGVAHHTGSTYASTGYFQYANAALSNAFTWRRNAGVSGDTTAQMLARIQSDVLAYSPAWVSVLGGVNDITTDVPASTTTANLQSIYDTILAAGIRLVVCVVTPCTSFPTYHSTVDTINTFIRTYAAAHSPVVLVDWWSVFSDPATDSGYAPKAGYTSDGKHPSATGASVLGTAWAAAITAAGAVPGT